MNYNIKAYIGIQPPTYPEVAKTFFGDPYVNYEEVNIKFIIIGKKHNTVLQKTKKLNLTFAL